ncbi:ArsR/SmtB family transcription factor [Salisediminibacterium beveridgei]|uniref:Cadmium efflux system accessory protein n=1 Tax=Salisediminibacterium beveridgei TaxID=632773 RepID=A0A1D7QZF4_9BACI|nr:metalloregulator ArsR/SmtB family transcription factor [Salisediminibacterium beveridgei]AOM84330.1 Cadmium efflux system accessory protein [Salisediminibacterium beveridgei]
MTQLDTCEIYQYDQEKVSAAKKALAQSPIQFAANLFKALGEENRAKIAYALCHNDELCVCDLANIIDATVATTSHHLRTLYKQDIVKFRKEGKLAFYSLDDDHIRQLVMTALEHAKEGVNAHG